MLNDEFFHLMLGSPVIKACRDLGIPIKPCVLSSVNSLGHDSQETASFSGNGISHFAACK